MKASKIIALVLALVMVIGLFAGCGKTEPAAPGAPAAPADPAAPAAPAAPADPGADEPARDLVVSGEVEPNTVRSDETLTVVLSEEPASLLASNKIGTHGLTVTNLLVDMPYNYNQDTGEVEPYLFTAWEWVDDAHTQIKCTVREGVIASDGSVFNADDVYFSLKEYKEMGGSQFIELVDIEKTEVVDEYNIIIGVASGNPTFLESMCNRGTVFMLDESSYLAGGGRDNTTVPKYGTGKYNFVEWIPGQYILLERNENHWDTKNIPYYKFIKFTFVPDAATRIMNIQSGNADVAVAINVGQATELIGDEKCGVTFVSTQNANRIFLNSLEGHPTADIKVRQAIRYALNPEMLNMVHSNGVAPIEPYYITSESKYYFDPTNGAGIEYSPEKAKQLLEEAGYGDGLVINGLAQAQATGLMTAAQAMLKEVGITLEFITPDVPTYLEKSKAGDFDLIFTETANCGKFFRDKIVFSVIEPGCVWPGNPQIDDPELLALVKTATGSLNEEEAVEAIYDIVQYVYDDVWVLGLGRTLNAVAHNPGLEGFYAGTGTSIDVSLIRPIS